MDNQMDNLTRLLSLEKEDEYQETEEIFDLVYRGSSEIDRHYTKPMLPWIISEIKNQHKVIQVKVHIQKGSLSVIHKEKKSHILSHMVKQIHKCVMEQADHRCFLYTLRSSEKDPSHEVSSIQPSNIDLTQNYQCHLYQALTEQEVRDFFSCLRQQPRDGKIPDLNSFNSLADLSVHTESLFFEVMFVGRVKVSHCKVPVTFIDEALEAFKRKEKRRQRHGSSEEVKQPSSPNRLMTFQQEGSGYSVPNIVFKTVGGDASKYNKMGMVGSKGLAALENVNEQDISVSSATGNQAEPAFTSASSFSSNNSSAGQIVPLDRPSDMPVRAPSDANVCENIPAVSNVSNPLEHVMRSRSGSTGSVMPRSRYTTPSDSDLKALGYDFNRTMLFHIGHREIQLINPKLKSVQLHKPFKDIASCCQGIQASDHFGFICREISGNDVVYVGYVFRCDQASLSDEIMQVLNRSFSAMHEEHEKDRKDHLMCDFCPLKWFSQLCADVEGLPAQKAHYIIMKRVTLLPEEERDVIIMKYEGVETSEVAQKNIILMMLLRTHFEYKQMNHTHPSQENQQRSDFLLGTNIESSLKKAKQSITTSFSQLLKKKDSDILEKENVRPVDAVSSNQSPNAENSSYSINNFAALDEQHQPQAISCSVVEGVSDSPLKPYRSRSSTISGMDGDSMRKELIQSKRKNEIPQKRRVKAAASTGDSDSPSRKVDMFLKFGSSTGSSVTPIKDYVLSHPTEDEIRPMVSFRQSILKKVASPAKGVPESRSRKISTPVMGQKYVCFPPRTRSELKILWKKAVFQQIILIRIERENQRLRALQKEAALQRVRLNYEEVDLPFDAIQTWEMLLSRPHARIDSSITCAGIKQGIPKIVRGDVWNLLMIQHQLYHQKISYASKDPNFTAPYERLIKELTSHQHAILIDIGRTFPSHPYFTQTLGPGQLALFNVLKAYSILDPEVGYCQGLSFVGGVLLLHFEEELAYDVLKHLMFERGFRKHYRLELDGLQVRMYQLSRLVHDRLHHLYEHLEEHEVTPQLYSAPWFLTLFASQFPLHFVVRVFDLLFLNGTEAIFYVAFCLLQTHESKLLSLNNFEEIMEYFKSTVPDISIDEQTSFFDQVCDCNFQTELSAYEVEYNVLKEELFATPQQDASMTKLKEANKNLKKQNLDLLEELHGAKLKQQSLESSNQSLLQSQHHLEVRVRWLEIERNNMRLLIETLSKNCSSELLSTIPASLERYLPSRTSSPTPPESRVARKTQSTSAIVDKVPSACKEITISVPPRVSWKHDTVTSDSSALESPLPSSAFLSPSNERVMDTRSSTLDPQEMRDYLRRVIGGQD